MRIALAQFDPVADPTANLATLDRLAERAAAGGADLLLAPEGSQVAFLTDPQAPTRVGEPLDGPFVSGLRELSTRHGLTVAAGLFTNDGSGGRVHNTLAVAADGELLAGYRKIHLYDAFSFAESDTVAPGDAAPPVLEIAGVRVGFATCYDLRFPELFRVLQDDGAEVLALASAWVAGPLKEEHFLTLLKARAIENTCYVVAADQIGRAGIGRSSAFDPAGLPLLDLGAATEALGFVDISRERLDQVRAQNPAITNRRFGVQRVLTDPASR